jgi:chemotaxis protein CheZ
VEQRVNAMIELMGRADIESFSITLPDSDQREGDDALLNGPQLPGEEISQDEIDKIFA